MKAWKWGVYGPPLDARTGTACSRPPGAAVTAWVTLAMGSLIGLTVFGQFTSDTPTDLLVLDIVVGAVSCALVPVLLRWPVAGALALTLLAAVSPVATPPATFGALHVAQRRPFAIAAKVGAAGIMTQVVRDLWRPTGGLSFVWWLALVIVGYAALVGWGTLTQARHALLESLHERARRAEAEQGRRVAEARMLERTRIAREMHDVLAHRLSLLATYAGAVEYRPDAPPEQLSRAAGVIRAGAHQALEELRQVITVLRDDGEPDDGEPEGRPQPGIADLSRLVEESRDVGTHVHLREQLPDRETLPSATGRTVYRVVQEGLTNARKHAAGQAVRVVIEGSPGAHLLIDISNRLPGSAGPPASPGAGTGLIGLAERVQLAGGRLDHQITAVGEFRLRASLPWPA